jgi:hypothetical protein
LSVTAQYAADITKAFKAMIDMENVETDWMHFEQVPRQLCAEPSRRAEPAEAD